MIKVVRYNPNQKVLSEISAIEKQRDFLHRLVDQTDSLNHYLDSFLSSVNGQEFVKMTHSLPKSFILDIGFGKGETSLYLASKGHNVVSLEPSRLNCEILEKLAKKFGLKILIYQAVAEVIDQIEEDLFDLCIFQSSLHHCDDPIKAISLCKKKLKIKGKILAINEPLLKCYQTKKRYFRNMEKNPVKMGHYGGNEHIYSYKEYIALFKKSGFQNVQSHLHTRLKNPRMAIYYDLNRKIDGKYIHSNKKLLVKFCVLLLIEKCFRKGSFSKLFLSPAKKLSLLPVTFEAQDF